MQRPAARAAFSLGIGGMLLALAATGAVSGAAAETAKAGTDQTSCAGKKNVLGVERIVTIDTAKGALYGNLQYKANADLLQDKEVVLTFDDGPMPARTTAILDALDRECTKATFFAVGRMAIAYQANVKDVLRRGHTLGTHTWSHRRDLNRISHATAAAELERGFSAVQKAAGQPIAPFFRFPYLNDPKSMISYLSGRDVGIFSIDIDSGDTRGLNVNARRIIEGTMKGLESRGKGILLFHDIKKHTAEAIPELLRQLREKGYKVVHLVPKDDFKSKPDFDRMIDKQYPSAAEKEKIAEAEMKAPPVPVRKAASPASETASVAVPLRKPDAKKNSAAAKPAAVAADTEAAKAPVANPVTDITEVKAEPVKTLTSEAVATQTQEIVAPDKETPAAKREADQTDSSSRTGGPIAKGTASSETPGSSEATAKATVTPAIVPGETMQIPLPVQHPKPKAERSRRSQLTIRPTAQPATLRGRQAEATPTPDTPAAKAAMAVNWTERVSIPR